MQCRDLFPNIIEFLQGEPKSRRPPHMQIGGSPHGRSWQFQAEGEPRNQMVARAKSHFSVSLLSLLATSLVGKHCYSGTSGQVGDILPVQKKSFDNSYSSIAWTKSRTCRCPRCPTLSRAFCCPMFASQPQIGHGKRVASSLQRPLRVCQNVPGQRAEKEYPSGTGLRPLLAALDLPLLIEPAWRTICAASRGAR